MSLTTPMPRLRSWRCGRRRPGPMPVLVVTPEYNGTIPAVLKNAIDWLSRPYGAGALNGKPLAVIGSALGQYGGVWAHDDTRKSFGIAGARVIEDITVSVPSGHVRR